LARRTITILLGAAAALIGASPAHAALVYVKRASTEHPRVYVARDDGTHPHRLGEGRSPTISPNGRWVAWVRPGPEERVLLRRADRSRKPRRVADAASFGELRFAPNSKLLGMIRGRRLMVYDIRTRTQLKAAKRDTFRGFSFAPDSKALVYATSWANEAPDAPADLYSVDFGTRERMRITRDRRSLNPLWGPEAIIHDRQRRRPGDAPSYNLFDIHPDGGSLRRITSLRIPPLVSGLVPVELSEDGSRLLANFVGQDTQVGFRVNPETGRTHALSRDFEHGVVATDLSDDGSTVLGHTGGPDPTARHNVVTIPYAGGEPTILVRRAMSPAWSR
jgi:hypothetical protein